MIYCVGDTKNYLSYLERAKITGEPFQKKGKDASYINADFPYGYPGGSVWENRVQAQKHCGQGQSVFGVIAQWNIHTRPSDDGNWHDLLVNAEIISLPEETLVANIRDTPPNFASNNNYAYIGRPGRKYEGYFGNPIKLSKLSDRETVLDQYRTYFYQRLASDPEFKYRVHGLKNKILVCFCKPLTCHGDVIAEYLNSI